MALLSSIVAGDTGKYIVAMLLLIALSIDALILIIATVAFADRQGDSIVLVAAVLSFLPALSSFPSSLYRLLPAVVSRRNQLPTWLTTLLTTFCPRAWFLWIIPSLVGLTFAFQQPSCGFGGEGTHGSWREGLPCRLHRMLVALSVTMLALDFTSSQLLERRRRRQTGSDSDSCNSWASETTLAKAEPLYQARQNERWLQRRNSLSSQQAIYPSIFPALHGKLHTHRPSTASSRTLQSGCSSFELSDRSSSFTSSSTSTATRRYRKPPRADCPSIPELPKSTEDLPCLPVCAPPPPAWCPPLQHAPLSADPTIRALSGTSYRAASYSSSQHTRSSVAPSHLPPPPPPPALPRRASGHCGRSVTSHNNANLSTSAASLKASTTHTNTSSTRALRRIPSIRYPNRQKLWTYTPSTASSVAGEGVGLGSGMGPSMYSASSYGTHGTRGSTYIRL